MSSKEAFHQLIAGLTAEIAGRPLDENLDQWLNATHGAGSPRFEQLRQACIGGVAEGWLCEREGIEQASVLAFGDMPNDVPMLTWAGRSVAMANAHPAVREVADDVTLSNDEDGVAHYLARTFGL